MNLGSIQVELKHCKSQVDELNKKLDAIREQKKGNVTLTQKGSTASNVNVNLAQRKQLVGHFGKVYALSWCLNDDEEKSNLLVSCSQDGKLIVWDGMSTNKRQMIPLPSAWVMTTDFAPSGNYLACGGLDNQVSIYRYEPGFNPKKKTVPLAQMNNHEGYVSGLKFLNDSEILSSSGDGTCMLWDINSKRCKTTFTDHMHDVMGVTTLTDSTFVSCGVDATAKVWDLRSGRCVQTHSGHESDVNAVTAFPDGFAFATASDDSSCRLFDTRCWGQVNEYRDDKLLESITSVSFSRSGRLLFSGTDNGQMMVWDALKGSCKSYQVSREGPTRVSCLGVNQKGSAVATGCWDQMIKIYA